VRIPAVGIQAYQGRLGLVIDGAHLVVAGESGVELIPTADLAVDGDGLFNPVSLRTVRDRLNRSVGR